MGRITNSVFSKVGGTAGAASAEASPAPAASAAQKALWAGAVGGALIVGLALYFFAPDQHRFYPRCLFHALTGLQCPGCGGLRATHRLLHGDIAGAWHFNPLLVSLAPVLGIWAVAYGVNQPTGEKLLRLLRKPVVAWGMVAVVVLFAIVRNLRG